MSTGSRAWRAPPWRGSWGLRLGDSLCVLEGVLDLPGSPVCSSGWLPYSTARGRKVGRLEQKWGSRVAWVSLGAKPMEQQQRQARGRVLLPELLVPARVGVRRLESKGCRWAGWQVSTCLCA